MRTARLFWRPTNRLQLLWLWRICCDWYVMTIALWQDITKPPSSLAANMLWVMLWLICYWLICYDEYAAPPFSLAVAVRCPSTRHPCTAPLHPAIQFNRQTDILVDGEKRNRKAFGPCMFERLKTYTSRASWKNRRIRGVRASAGPCVGRWRLPMATGRICGHHNLYVHLWPS